MNNRIKHSSLHYHFEFEFNKNGRTFNQIVKEHFLIYLKEISNEENI